MISQRQVRAVPGDSRRCLSFSHLRFLGGFWAHFAPFFGLRPLGRRVPVFRAMVFWEPSTTKSSSLSRGHGRLSVAMALSEKKHTSRGQEKDRAGRWVRNAVHGQVPEPPTPSRSSSSCLRESSAVPGHPVWVSRREAQEQVQQRTVEQLADVVPTVQILEIPVAQVGDHGGFA